MVLEYYFCSLHLLAQTRFVACALTISLDFTTICHENNALNVFLKVFGFTQSLLMFFLPPMFDISCVCVYNVNYTTNCLSASDDVWRSNLFWVDKISPKMWIKNWHFDPYQGFFEFLGGKTPQPRSQGFELGSPDLEGPFSPKPKIKK
jgi:hypothetical protein